MEGRARAPAAGTVLNALASGTGSAFAIDLHTTATVELTDEPGIDGTVVDDPSVDTTLIERCVSLVLERFDRELGGVVRTESEIPIASGLKSSSAAANATVLATLHAIEKADELPREDACRLGVEAAREVGVTVTGAFDDASASMLGGITVTDNRRDRLLARDQREWDVLVWTPPVSAFSADADADRCRRIATIAELIAELALEGEHTTAMTINGLAFAAALGFDAEPMIEVLPEAEGVSLSGTGPSFTAVGSKERLEDVRERWDTRPGSTIMTRTQTEGAIIDG